MFSKLVLKRYAQHVNSPGHEIQKIQDSYMLGKPQVEATLGA